MKSNLLIVINSLHSGGAEKSCIDLARFLTAEHNVHVVSLIIGGPAEEELRAIGIRVTVLHADTTAQKLRSFVRLARIVRDERPPVVITFLYIADLVGGLLTRLLVPGARVIWNVRNNVLTRRQSGATSYVTARLNSMLSRWVPDAVVYCSETSRVQHEQIGFRPREVAVVENSAAAIPFAFDETKRRAFRDGRFGDDFVFLFVARLDPVKRVDLYLEACVETARRVSGVRFALAGRGMDDENSWMHRYVQASGIPERFDFLGFVSDQQALYSSADCLIVTSDSEGSPNVVYEAMATELPVVILGTIGTEHIRGERVRRIDSRQVERLVAAMLDAVREGRLPASVRTGPSNARTGSERPLVGYYRAALPSV